MRSINFPLFLVICLIASNTWAQTSAMASEKPKNIILLIADGMGLAQLSVSQFYNDDPSSFEQFPVVGLAKTSASNSLITDSAASATAYASGIKTYNGAVGVRPDSTSVSTIVELISPKISTGLISTSSIVHATPAAFYAHVVSRRMYYDIAEQLVHSEIDFFAGGGTMYFSKRDDGKNLIGQLEGNGFSVHTEALPEKTRGKTAILLAENAMPKMVENRGNFLPDATTLAIKNLSRDRDGFFLMVEGSQVDWGGHSNNADYLITELVDFDKAVGAALDFAKRDGNTLVIVTADHETGGFALSSDGNNYNKIGPTFSTSGHTATMVPVLAYGPGSENFSGIYENTEIYHKMMSLLSDD